MNNKIQKVTRFAVGTKTFESEADAALYLLQREIESVLNWNCEGVDSYKIQSYINKIIMNRKNIIDLLVEYDNYE